MLDELHSSLMQGLRVLPGPDLLQPLLDDRTTVLHNEPQLGVYLAQLQGKSANASPDINYQGIPQGRPWEICVTLARTADPMMSRARATVNMGGPKYSSAANHGQTHDLQLRSRDQSIILPWRESHNQTWNPRIMASRLQQLLWSHAFLEPLPSGLFGADGILPSCLCNVVRGPSVWMQEGVWQTIGGREALTIHQLNVGAQGLIRHQCRRNPIVCKGIRPGLLENTDRTQVSQNASCRSPSVACYRQERETLLVTLISGADSPSFRCSILAFWLIWSMCTPPSSPAARRSGMRRSAAIYNDRDS